MKKKIFFTIISILMIIISIISIINSNVIIEETIKDAIDEEYINMYKNHGHLIIGAVSLFIIFLNLYVLKVALKNQILPKKGGLILVYILNFIFGISLINNVISVLAIIVLILLKRKNPEDYPIKTEIPKIENEKITKKERIWSIVLLITYLAYSLIGFVLTKETPLGILITLSVIFYTALFTISIIGFKDKILKGIKLFKENAKAYIKFLTTRFIVFFIVYFLISVFCLTLNGGKQSVNQQSLEMIPLWISAPLSIIWAPIVEEAVFRGCLRRFIKNNVIFIIISAISFGFIHIVEEGNIVKMIIEGLPYATMGAYLAYIYSKSNNIVTNILSHSFWNVIVCILMAIKIIV